MTITINGTAFDSVTSLNVKRETRRTDIRYNTQGDMLIDLVNRKYVLEAAFGLLSEKEMKKLRELCSDIFVSVTFPSPEGTTTADFHIPDEPAPVVSEINGTRTYSGVKLKFLQK